MSNSPFIIAINRQLGSGGSFIGQQIARNLNLFYADREIIREAAEKLSLMEEDLESHDEKKDSFWRSFFKLCAFSDPDAYIPPKPIAPTDRKLFEIESEIIRRIGQERSAVIIGRCGSYVLRDHPNLVSMFIYADTEFRKKRIQEIQNVSEEAAGKMIAQSDKERALYYRTFTGEEWTDLRQYDLSLETSKIGLDKGVEFILKYLEYRGIPS
ncbi:MAG TPA: cytidylate kinase-like family protein [Bacteroidota bacterium]|nr:cytidylate kinase-like family protein [Bacteroidota bacterium]